MRTDWVSKKMAGQSIWFRILFLIILCSSGLAKAADEPESVVWRYKKALLSRDGKSAWEAVDSLTQNFYSEIVRDAISATRSDVERLDLMARLTLIRARVEFKKSALSKMTGRDLFIYSVDNGWISRSTVESITKLKIVSNDGRLASAALPEQPTIPLFYMIREDGEWKLSLVKGFELINFALQQAVKESGMSENEFILSAIRTVSRFEVTDALFDGPIEDKTQPSGPESIAPTH